MADSFDIQRVPLGLQNLLNLFGGQTPQELAPQVHGVLDLLQFYGLSQRTTLVTNNAALAAAGTVDIVTPNNAWALLFAANGTVIRTATQTALRFSVSAQRGASGNFQTYAHAEVTTFGATLAGPQNLPFVPSYGFMLPPASTIRCRLDNLGTDANANVTIAAEIGLFG